MSHSREWARSVAETALSEFLAQFTEDEQEHVIRYALDHVVPKLKSKSAHAPISPIEPEQAPQTASPSDIEAGICALVNSARSWGARPNDKWQERVMARHQWLSQAIRSLAPREPQS